ncbi:MAG: PilZ domain-containing protein [Desulfobacteraceae bacterium]|nr:MAG: PilZ domain-containing protein [Desulfobacteraceae bacterium]
MTGPQKTSIKVKKNNRKRLRIDFEAQVVLRFEPLDIILEARMKNISMNGIFVETGNSIALNTPCRIEVMITAPNSRLTIETEGFVCRHDPSGLGVAFKNNLEWFAFFSIFEHYGKGYGAR